MKHLIWLMMWVAVSCTQDDSAKAPQREEPPAPVGEGPKKKSDQPKSMVVQIEMPEMESPLPEGPGRDTVDILCGVCHSHRYITMQPRFGRKAWEASVDKMKKTFGAPIPDEKVKEVVDYLVQIRGVE